MKIAVNTRFLIKNKLEGIGWFTFETMSRLAIEHPEHEFIFLFDRMPDKQFIFSTNVKPIVLNPQARHPILWYLWFECSVARFLKRNKVDVFVSTDGYIPLNTKVPCLSVIHDINFEHYPEGIPAVTGWYYKYFFPRFAKKATRIATVSEFSKSDIVETYNIDSKKIDVVYNGASNHYSAIGEEEKINFRNKYTNGRLYFIFVGALNPRKNVARLLLAFDAFIEETNLDFYLLIVGEKMFKTHDIDEAYKSIRNSERVVFTGRLSQSELKDAIGASLAMTFVSYFEGFGIPALEAMYCDVPLIASNRTSIPEVAGDAAFYVDPFSVESIAKGMKLLATDAKLREALVAAASKRKAMFTWDKTAAALYSSIEKTIAP
jgi:glycosyltransferase involved in cell wall biosynthesis